MENPKTAPYLSEDDKDNLLTRKNGEIPNLRRSGEIGYRELYSLALYHLASLVATLLPAGSHQPVNGRRLNQQLMGAYADMSVVFRNDLLGALACREEGCLCHRAIYNILAFGEIELSDADRELVGELAPDRVECPEELEQMIRESVFVGQAPNPLADLLRGLFGEPPAQSKKEKIEA